MIDGLKLTMTGEEIFALLEERIGTHEARAENWRFEAERSPGSGTEEEPLLPDEMCTNEEKVERWRADVLRFIQEHLDVSEVYRLTKQDLKFAELLPEKPDCLKQEDYERENAVRFAVERLYRSRNPFDFGRRRSKDE